MTWAGWGHSGPKHRTVNCGILKRKAECKVYVEFALAEPHPSQLSVCSSPSKGRGGEPAVLIQVYPQVWFLSSCGSDEKMTALSLEQTHLYLAQFSTHQDQIQGVLKFIKSFHN